MLKCKPKNQSMRAWKFSPFTWEQDKPAGFSHITLDPTRKVTPFYVVVNGMAIFLNEGDYIVEFKEGIYHAYSPTDFKKLFDCEPVFTKEECANVRENALRIINKLTNNLEDSLPTAIEEVSTLRSFCNQLQKTIEERK